MILPLRRAHRVFAVLLAVVLPILVLIALLLRPAGVVPPDWPDTMCIEIDGAER